jgi:hypothetical protein
LQGSGFPTMSDHAFARWVLRLAVASAALWPVCQLAIGCRAPTQSNDPVIEFTVVPAADNGGPEKVAPVAGRVSGAGPNQRIVLFARSGGWWVQPYRSRPFTTIQSDSTWKNTIHLGTEYAALLVAPDFRPPATMDSLPPRGGAILAVATAKGSGSWVPPPPKTVTFSGYDWHIVQTRIDRHGPNDCDARNVWVDADGHLHLLLTQRDGRWTSAALTLDRALGYGTYAFTVRDTSTLDPAAALSMYTWDDRADQTHRELNISIGTWGNPRNKNAQYVLQFEDVADNVFRYDAPAGRLTHTFRWEPGRASFSTVRGSDIAAGQPVANRQFTVGVPAPATATVRLCLISVAESPNPPAGNVEVVVEKFVYLP